MVSRWEAQAEPAVTGKKTVIIGTEEYMFPGLMLGEMLEKTGLAESVRFHATTRSPIGLNSDPGYPIRSGFSLSGFYEAGRRTFLYNIGHYDTAILVTDSDNEPQIRKAADALAGILENQGCRRVILFQEEHHVQHL